HGRGIRSRAHRTQALFFKEGGTNEVSDGCFWTTNAPIGQQHPRTAPAINPLPKAEGVDCDRPCRKTG
ncbi:MAG: hypothetical protein FWB93_04170, partial [Oscillospiraceae bacterium]|nr:hypothetical protein [Oscillospiraceae bacterium]